MQSTKGSSSGEKRRLGLSGKTVIGLLLGVACGLFFGELCGWLNWIGDAFVGLLQMTVVPYIAISLMASIGRLKRQQASRLVGRIGIFLLVFWIIGLLMIVLLGQCFPQRPSAAFFSDQLLEQPEQLNFLELFIPTNPFRALANNWIPAVVVFSVGMGIALMGMPNKESLISQLDQWMDLLKRLNNFVVKATPYGVFAIVAGTAGTMTFEDMAKIQAYLIAFTVGSIILGLLVIPAIVTSCTPFTYREIVRATLQASITAFATGKLIVVLPLLVEETKKLFERHGHGGEEVQADIDVVYPLVYPIPNLGKLLSLVFIPFAAWFAGGSMDWDDYAALLSLGSITYFGKPIVATPFLLDAFRLPSELFQLFIVSGVYTARVGDVLAVVHVFSVTVLSTSATRGLFKVRLAVLLFRLGISVLIAIALLAGTRAWLGRSMSEEKTLESVVAEMQLLRNPSPAVVRESAPTGAIPRDANVGRLDAIYDSGVLRIGYRKDRLPFSFLNGQGDLVGLDIDMAHLLARDMKCTLEFVPYEIDQVAEQLRANHFDVAMTATPVTITNLSEVRLTDPYLDLSLSFVVPDYRRDDFATMEKVRENRGLRIAVPSTRYIQDKATSIKEQLPHAELDSIGSIREFFESGHTKYDALILDAESGSAWSFRYPGFVPVVPSDLHVRQPVAYAVAREDADFAEFLSQWLLLQKSNGELEALYDHWIRGEVDQERPPRWSVLRNVLGIGRSSE